MAKTVDFYVALPSPWTYLAFPRFREIAAKTGATVNYKPFDLMQIFGEIGTKAVGQRPPQIQKNRLNELRRWRDFLGMPLNLHPEFFPVDQKLAARMAIAARQSGADIGPLCQAILTAVWAEERNIADPETLKAIADAQGLDGAALLSKADGGKPAEEFERNSQEASERNVFGAPTWIIDDELYWGQDRLDFVGRHLGA